MKEIPEIFARVAHIVSRFRYGGKCVDPNSEPSSDLRHIPSHITDVGRTGRATKETTEA
jgi:hypothetical protein